MAESSVLGCLICAVQLSEFKKYRLAFPRQDTCRTAWLEPNLQRLLDIVVGAHTHTEKWLCERCVQKLAEINSQILELITIYQENQSHSADNAGLTRKADDLDDDRDDDSDDTVKHREAEISQCIAPVNSREQTQDAEQVKGSSKETEALEEEVSTTESLLKDHLTSNHVQLVEELDVESFEHLLPKFLQNTTKGTKDKTDKARKLLLRLHHYPEEIINQVTSVIAGLHPNLFHLIHQRDPETKDADSCMETFTEDLKQRIIDCGHTPDISSDKKIDLDDQFIKLKLVKEEKPSASSVPVGHDDLLPHKYQQYLESNTEDIGTEDILPKTETPGFTALLMVRAGVGKTTLMQWLLRQFALGKWATSFVTIFVLNLRFLSRVTSPVTLSNLLKNHSLYNLHQPHPQFPLWMSNCMQRVTIILEGLDEVANLSLLLKSTRELRQEALAVPMDWVINILQGKVLPDACKIVTSRHFNDLKDIHANSTIELQGLTRTGIKKFIKKHVVPEKRQYVEESLEKNPHIFSICGITFYASVFCRILEGGTELPTEVMDTYTRIVSFIILTIAERNRQHVSTYPGPYGSVQILADVLPALSRLAARGLVQDQCKVKEDATTPLKLVFDQKDMVLAKVTVDEQNAIEKSGLLVCKRLDDLRGGKILLNEFLHLSIQEMLAAGNLLKEYKSSSHNAPKALSTSGQFNMINLFLAGLALDNESEWVQALRLAIKYKDDMDITRIEKSRFIKQVPTGEGDHGRLQTMLFAQESKDEELIAEVAKEVLPKEDVSFEYLQLTSVDVQALVSVMRYRKHLRSVKLSHTNIDDRSSDILLSYVSETPSIKKIDLMGNQITADGLQKLKAIPECINHITEIWLDHNQIGDAGAESLAEALRANKCLSTLGLVSNQIGDPGAESLAEALKVNTGLSALVLGSNQIGDAGAESLAEALKANTGLSALGLNDNQIGDAGCESLAEALRSSKCLSTVWLHNNQIGAKGAASLSETLRVNKHLRRLRIGGNRIPEKEERELKEAGGDSCHVLV